MADPPIRVVSSQSEQEVKRREALAALKWPLREVAANLMRIAKGGGRPEALLQQFEDCSKALRGYAEEHGLLPDARQVQQILDCDIALDEFRPWVRQQQSDVAGLHRDADTGEDDRGEAMGLIRRGALQCVASMLLDQLSQQRMGEKDIGAGIRLLGEARLKKNGKPSNASRASKKGDGKWAPKA